MTVREQAPAALTDIALTVLRKRYLIKDDHGRVIEEGSHEQLMANNHRYARLFTLQAEGYR